MFAVQYISSTTTKKTQQFSSFTKEMATNTAIVSAEDSLKKCLQNVKVNSNMYSYLSCLGPSHFSWVFSSKWRKRDWALMIYFFVSPETKKYWWFYLLRNGAIFLYLKSKWIILFSHCITIRLRTRRKTLYSAII